MDIFDGMDWGAYATFQVQAKNAPAFLGPLMQFGDFTGSYLGAAILLALAVVATPYSWRRRMAIVILVTFLFGALLVEGVKEATLRTRPPDSQNFLGSAEVSPSFPSRPVFLAAYAWLMLALAWEYRSQRQSERIAIYGVASLGIVFVCISELWLSLNFVTDVLAGLAGGLGLALLARWAMTPGERKAFAP
jgi:undecaprenyl-diphosphatase